MNGIAQTCLNGLKAALNMALFAQPTPEAGGEAQSLGGRSEHPGFGDLAASLNGLGHIRIQPTPVPKDGYVVIGDGEEKRADKLTEYEREREALLQPIARRAIEAYLTLSELAADWNAAFDTIEELNTPRKSKRIREGKKPNLSLFLLDRSVKLQRTQADIIRYQEDRLLEAKKLVDECVAEWSANSNQNLVKLVELAFKKGRRGYSRSAMLTLRSMESDDPRWLRAMAIIREAEILDGAASYLLASVRDEKGEYIPIPLDMAAVRPWPLPNIPAQPKPIKPIRNDADHAAALAEINELMRGDPEPDSPEGERLELLTALCESWELRRHPDHATKI